MTIIEFKPKVIAGGVTDDGNEKKSNNENVSSNNPFPVEPVVDYVGEAMSKANNLDFDQVIIIGTTADGFINYIHSDLGEERIVYLTTKLRHFVLNGGMD